MEARSLIGNAAYSPDVLKVLYEAFDGAWATIAASCGTDEQAIEATRIRLANTILALARDRPKPVAGELRDRALQLLGHTVGE
jgi:hypothetical protein